MAPRGADLIAAMPREHVYLASLLWDGLWIIQQPICNEIRQEEPVLFVERPISVFSVLRYPELWPRLFAWLRGARRVAPGLRVLAPLPLFHLGHRFPWLFRLEFAIQRLWILLWLGRTRGRERVLWIDHPIFECALGRMGESRSVYHVGDDAAEFHTSHRATVLGLEDSALRKASFVFAAADELARARRGRNSRTFAIANAIDAALFLAPDPALELSDIDRLPAPRVAFVGVLDSWVDLEALEHLAVALPHVSVVMVGPSRVNDRKLRRLPNVHFVGVRHRRLVPGILRRASASLVPFRVNALTVRIVPAKIFEALAAGIEPVCTAFSRNLDALKAQGLISVARTEREFIDLVAQAIDADTPARRAELARFGLRQTWSDRWHQMQAILQEGQAVPDERGAAQWSAGA